MFEGIMIDSFLEFTNIKNLERKEEKYILVR